LGNKKEKQYFLDHKEKQENNLVKPHWNLKEKMENMKASQILLNKKGTLENMKEKLANKTEILPHMKVTMESMKENLANKTEMSANKKEMSANRKETSVNMMAKWENMMAKLVNTKET